MRNVVRTCIITFVLADVIAGLGFTVAGQQPVARAVHVTLHEGTSMAAALSPDHRTLAIDLLGTLWTMPADGGVAKPITDIFLDARQPSWSPDGKHLAFQAYLSSTWQIWTINADGTDLKPVTSGPYDDREPAWSPDGNRIAFSSDRSGSYDIWVVALASGAVQQVTFAPSNEFMPAWSGVDEIAYVSDRAGKPGVYSMPVATANRSTTDRLRVASDGAVAGPSVGPDGTIAFNTINGSHSRLMVGDRNIADADEDVFPFRPQWISPGELLYTADGKIKRRMAAGGPPRVVEFTADVSFTRPAFTPKRHRFDLAGAQRVRGIMHPAVSPDGSQVAFAALGDLWVMPIGGAPRRLTTDPAVETEPAWSPDGRSLAYSTDRGGSMNIWTRDLESGADRQITHAGNAAMLAAWSPDGARIAFVDSDGQLQVVDVKSGAVTKVHDHLNEPGRASWSPDGTAIVVSSLKVYSTRFREGTNQVLRVAVPGVPGVPGGPDRWFDPSPHKSIGMREDGGPVWSPDGTQMAAVVDGLLTAWPVGRDGAPLGPPRPLSTELAGSPTWTADSRRILYQTDTGLKLVDVSEGAARRVVREIDPRLTWTPSSEPPAYMTSGARGASARAVTIHAGRLWDGRSDALRNDVDILVEGTRIKRVEPHRAEFHSGTVIDATSETVIPGLIEIHTHLSKSYGEALGREFLSWGITTVRNPATNTFETLENREAFESGARIGPRLLTTGEPFDGTRVYYPGGMSLDDSGQLPLQLQHARDFGYDFVKTYVRLPDLMQKRIIEEAHRMGMPVTSHELYPAVAFGADGVEHIRGTSRRGYSPKITALSRSYRDVIDLLTASKMTLTPTIGIQGGFRLQTLRDHSWLNDPRIQQLYPAPVRDRWREQTATPASAAVIEEARRLVAPQERTVYLVVKGGGRVTAGTDAPINPYGLSLLMELENYASGGLTPVEVLRTATMVSADAMGVGADLGSVEPGKLADMVIIAGDPLANIKDLRRVRRVIKDGNVYDLEALLRRPTPQP
ncbi:MAG TPA: amidohydrolase family protein [Vicinamibacterales bacterium]|nr:amidohydrolase family protein [Vicinamibacterales bacterium]